MSVPISSSSIIPAFGLENGGEIEGKIIWGNGDFSFVLDSARELIGNMFYVRVAWVKNEKGGYDYMAQVGKSDFDSDSDHPFTDLVVALGDKEGAVRAIQFFGSIDTDNNAHLIYIGIGEDKRTKGEYDASRGEVEEFLEANEYRVIDHDQALAVSLRVEV